MPTERVRSSTITFQFDGKTVDVKRPSKKNFDLNKALRNPTEFRAFTNDPKSFAARFDFVIDDVIADQLKEQLAGFQSIEDVASLVADRINRVGATVWAVASPAYSVATSKVAVAF